MSTIIVIGIVLIIGRSLYKFVNRQILEYKAKKAYDEAEKSIKETKEKLDAKLKEKGIDPKQFEV